MPEVSRLRARRIVDGQLLEEDGAVAHAVGEDTVGVGAVG